MYTWLFILYMDGAMKEMYRRVMKRSAVLWSRERIESKPVGLDGNVLVVDSEEKLDGLLSNLGMVYERSQMVPNVLRRWRVEGMF